MDTQLARAEDLMAQGAFAEAHEILKDLPLSTPDVMAKKGRALSALGQDQAALNLFEQALAQDPECAEALASRGAVYLRNRKHAEAEADLNRAVELAPTSERYRCNRGVLLAQVGRAEQALEDLNIALQNGFKNSLAYLVRGQLLLNQKEFEGALNDIRKALEHGADPGPACELEGVCHQALGSQEHAVQAFRNSLNRNPGEDRVWLRLLAIEIRSTPDRLQAVLEHGLALHPDPATFTQLYQEMLENVLGVESAVEVLKQAVHHRPDHIELLVSLAHAVRKTGQLEIAGRLFDQALQRDQNHPRALMGRAMALEDSQALPYFERAAATSADDAYTHYNLGSCLLRLGRYEASLESLQRSIELDGSLYMPFHERGMALDELNRYQEALQHYDRALELEPTSVDTWMNRGNTHRALGQYEKSLVDYQQAVALSPEEYLPRFNRALALKDLARHREALQEMEQVVHLQPGFARACYELGLLQKILKIGQDESSYKKACELDATFLEHPYGMPSRGPMVGTPPAKKPTPQPQQLELPTDDAGRLVFLVEQTSHCFHSVLPIFTRETLFSQVSEMSQLENLAMAFSISATYLACRRAGIDNWSALPELGPVLADISDVFAHHPDDADDQFRRAAVGAWVVAQFTDSITQELLADCDLIGGMVDSAAVYAHEKMQGKEYDLGQVDWNQRHQEYQAKLQTLATDGLNFAMDLDTGLYYWVREENTLALADMTVLGILGGDGSFLGGWACPQARGPSRPPLQMGLAGELHDADQDQAWEVVTLCAERLGVDYIETRPTGNVVMFLGLKNMRPPKAGEEFQGFAESRATDDVCNRLADLKKRLLAADQSPAELSDVFRSYAESIQQSGRTIYRDTPVAVRLVETGERVRILGNQLGQKKLFLLSRGKVPEKVVNACLQELDTLLREWGAPL